MANNTVIASGWVSYAENLLFQEGFADNAEGKENHSFL